MALKVLVCDDKELMRESLGDSLRRANYEVVTVAAGAEALEEVTRADYDVLITDLKMPGMDGLELLERVTRIAPTLPVVMITAYATVENAVRAMKLGAFDYIMKPFKVDQIEMVIEKAVRHRRLVDENERLRAQLEDAAVERPLVGSSDAMRRLDAEIRQIAPSRATVLITGESGTGKELVARAIHRLSPRANGAFVAVNCAALSAGILESELFGHEKGAFTGADKMRRGRFELAAGGTILLDEISEIDTKLQAKLLRVLQESEFERVGSSATLKTDARVLATTNRDLADAVERGTFRRDLFFRLNVVPVHVPPLRHHKEDIPELADYFLERFGRREGRPRRRLTEDALAKMAEYDWPGNVRELENVMERISVLDLPEQVTADVIGPWLGASSAGSAGGELAAVGMTVEEAERNLIRATLAKFGGHRANTAKALGIGLRTLTMKIKKWGL